MERHITPHGLRVMALQSWRTLICHLEAPKGQTLLHLGQILTFYLRRYGQNCPYCRKIEEIYKKKIHVT